MSEAPQSLKLDLADGQRWVIRPVDEEAVAIVAELGKAMRLGPSRRGRELLVATGSESDWSDAGDGGAVVCRLAATADRATQIIRSEDFAYLIACETLVRGGLLLHGALAEYRGSGFIMAGPGTVGKSTASRRLPLPWRSLCDDTTLVVRDGTGRYWAHPWPTWSLFHFGGTGGSWDVEHAVPLGAIFFLGKSPSDQLEPVSTTQAIALTIESAIDLALGASRTADPNSARTLLGGRVNAAKALALAVPAYSLKLSLNGRFWEEIERVLPVGDLPGSGEDSRNRTPVSVESLMAPDSLRVVCTGPSMIPTLQESDLLEVKPYGTVRVRPGDVVCFKSNETGKTVVHRVVSVGHRSPVYGRRLDGGPTGGIRTRGDNNPTNDPWVLQTGDIVGRVVAAQRGTRRRVVHGGWRGPLAVRFARLGRRIRAYAGPVPHVLYNFIAGLGPWDRLLPADRRPRLVRFEVRYRVFLKLLSGGLTVGQYDERLQRWHIRRPFRLFVDEQTLKEAAALVASRNGVQ